MKLLLSFLLLAFTSVVLANDCPEFFPGGKSPQLPQKLQSSATPICYSAYSVLHSSLSKTGLWSATHLTLKGLAASKYLDRDDSFHEEESIDKPLRAHLSDYAKSGYDRGHLTPSADMPTIKAQHESFSLANMIPQNPNNNRYLAKAIEISIRTLAKEQGEAFVITGVAYLTDEKLKSLKGRVVIPTHIYKAIYLPRANVAAAYFYENQATTRYDVMSINQLAEAIGYDPFPAVSFSVKEKAYPLPLPYFTGDATAGMQKASVKSHKGGLNTILGSLLHKS